ncbi:MAG: HupE/UreJ family protein [Flavobacteriales bacterium]|nr:HupE/UreJ family protein [Flavobacteriales bacterium]
MFPTYFQLGLTHITDLSGYDHILFLIALCAAYRYSDWKRILILVTAFTVGHSLTLALAVMHIIPVNGAWVEFLIPLTILITAIKNIGLANLKGQREASTVLTFMLAAGFGLIHGMGFSSFLRSMLGDELLLPLFAFNVGLEVGQLIIVAVIFGVQWAVMCLSGIALKWWNIVLSLLAAGVSVLLMAERVPF